VASKCDSSLFIKEDSSTILYVLVYVDDIIITGSSKDAIAALIQKLHSHFPLKDLGVLNFFLGVQVKYTQEGDLHLSQTKYIKELLQKAQMGDPKPMHTPMVAGQKLSKIGSSDFEDPVLYRSVVGALQYVTLTRPEISYSVNKVCQFMQCPKFDHWKAVKRILRYLSGTMSYGLLLKKSASLHLVAFCDSDWASDVDDRKSTSGFCVYLGQNPITWSSKKQPTVSRSSTEAEFRSLAATVTEILWLQSLLKELHVQPTTVPLVHCDNLSVVLLAANPVLHSKTKHMEIDLYFVRELVLQKKIRVQHLPSSAQVADILTKSISSTMFPLFRTKLSVVSHPIV